MISPATNKVLTSTEFRYLKGNAPTDTIRKYQQVMMREIQCRSVDGLVVGSMRCQLYVANFFHGSIDSQYAVHLHLAQSRHGCADRIVPSVCGTPSNVIFLVFFKVGV